MKKLFSIILICILFIPGYIFANNTNDLKFIGYSNKINSLLYEGVNGSILVINDKYKIYELFLLELGDWSVECNNKKELMKYYKAYKENRTKSGISKIKKTTYGYNVYFNFLDNKPYKVHNVHLNGLLNTYKEGLIIPFFFIANKSILKFNVLFL